MKDNKPEKDATIFGSEHLPQIEITVSKECIESRNHSREYILVEESQYYILGIFNVLMMMSNMEIHRDTDVEFGVRTIAFIGKTFTDIATKNLEYLEGKNEKS